MTVLLSALAFIVLLSVLILIHEWGHFKAARIFKVTVEEFGFGLPPKAKTLFKKGGTDFTLNWVPFGGFVRLKGENALTEADRKQKGSFAKAPIYARVIILVAGVFMNLVLAVSLLTVGFSYGRWLPTYLTVEDMEAASARGEIDLTLGVLIEDVMSGGAAAKVGVPPKSILKAIDGVEITKPTEVVPLQEEKWRVTYTLLTGEEFDSEETYRVVLQEGKTGVVLTSTALDLVVPKRGIMQGFALALRETKVMTVQTVLGIGRLVSSLTRTGTVPEGIAGIVGIYQLTHSSVQEGLMTYLRLVALLSLSLAVLNILPFPALDGGRLLFVLAEFVSRRPLNRRFELTTNAIGFTVLILLILIITIYDVARLF